MKLLQYLFLMLLVVFSQSCYKELDYEDLDFVPKIVLNGLIYQDSIIEVNVARTKSIIEHSEILPFLDNAEVKLFENDVYVEDLVYDSLGNYHSTITAKANTSYRLEATADELETATASFRLRELKDFTLSNIHYEITDTTVTFNDITIDKIFAGGDVPAETDTNLIFIQLKFDIVFTDDAAEENYYSYENYGNFNALIHTSIYNPELGEIEAIILEEESSAHLSFQNFHDYDKYYPNGRSSHIGYREGYYISDELFNGNEVDFSLRTSYYTGKVDPVEIILFSYPYEYVYFHITGTRYMNARDNPFSQPINIYSNVENGIGIVCGVSKSRQTIYLDRTSAI
jgi:hypothetical protein